jgi:hypothetical protein
VAAGVRTPTMALVPPPDGPPARDLLARLALR